MTEYVLEILGGDRTGQTVPLGTERVTLGRKPSNTVQLTDEKVSGEHAEIVLQDGRYVLRDLESRNGTLLDGRKIEEIVLSSFDAFQIGRILVQFREAGAEGLALHRIDQDRLATSRPRRGGVLGLLIGVIAVGGAGYWYTSQQKSGDDQAASSGRERSILRVAGNKLPEGVDDCELAEGWELAVAGVGFELGGPAHSGLSALQAARVVLEGEEDTAAGSDFALARTMEPVRVMAGESLRLTGWLRTAAGGRGAVRVRFSSSSDERFPDLWTGSHPTVHDEFTEVQLDLAVPPGMDRAQVEVLALLPSAEAEVLCDDLALVSGGSAAAIDLKAAACNLMGTGGAVALRAGRDQMIQRIEAAGGEGIAGLAASGLGCLTDAGAGLVVTGEEGGFRLETSPAADGMRLLFAPRAATLMRTRGADGLFRPQSGDFSVSDVDQLLIGSGPSRVLLRAAEPGTVSGQRVGDTFVVSYHDAAALDLVVAFDKERTAANEKLRRAEELVREGQPGQALDLLRELAETTPHESDTLSRGMLMRRDLGDQLSSRIEQLRADLSLSDFFRTRGAYRRIGDELSRLVDAYGEHNLPGPDEVKALQQRVTTQLAEIDAARNAIQRQDLEALTEVLAAAGETELRALVQSYIDEHLAN